MPKVPAVVIATPQIPVALALITEQFADKDEAVGGYLGYAASLADRLLQKRKDGAP